MMMIMILNKSWRQHPTKQQLYGHLPPITKTIKVRRTRNVGNCWRSRDELISDVPRWTPDTGYSSEDLPEAMNDWEEWRERVGISLFATRYDDDDDDVVIRSSLVF